MTQVHNLYYQKNLRMAKALESLDGSRLRRKDIARGDLMKVRRMAHEGKTADEIMEAIGFDGSGTTFRRKCKKFRIILDASRGRKS